MASSLTDDEGILIAIYRNPAAFYKTLSTDQRSVLMEWLTTGDIQLFKQIFFEFVSHDSVESVEIAAPQCENEIDLAAV